MSQFVVIDLEMCKVHDDRKKEYRIKQEIIQIGAVLLDEKYCICDRFSSFVKPEFGEIDPFIQELTGIGNDDVKDASDIETVLGRFFRWLPKDVVPVSWSTSDIKQLLHETVEKNLVMPTLEDLSEVWTDCQKEFSKKLDTRRCYSLEEALIATEIVPEGHAHDGLDDAANTAKLFSKIRTEEKMSLNPYYAMVHYETEKEPLTFTMGDLFAGISLAAG